LLVKKLFNLLQRIQKGSLVEGEFFPSSCQVISLELDGHVQLQDTRPQPTLLPTIFFDQGEGKNHHYRSEKSCLWRSKRILSVEYGRNSVKISRVTENSNHKNSQSLSMIAGI